MPPMEKKHSTRVCCVCKKPLPTSWHPAVTVCDLCEKAVVSREEALRVEERCKVLPYPHWDSLRGKEAAFAKIHKRAFGNKRAKSIYVCGSVGSGKTTGVCRCAREAASVMSLRFKLMPALLLQYSTELSNGGSKLPEQLSNPSELLILDDLGTGKITDRGVELLFIVLDLRMARQAPTWITSNLMIHEVGEWVARNDQSQTVQGKRITRRLYELCHDEVVLG